MSLNAEDLVAAELPERPHSWTADDVILYQLGLGAGVPATSLTELSYVYEAGLRVLPSYGVIAASQSLLDLFELPAFDVPLAQVLHAAQELEVHAALPVAAEVLIRARVSAVYDTGRHAIVVVETTTTAVYGGASLCSNRFSLFVRGAGGFGGERTPADADDRPSRDPDHVVDRPTLEQQALIYRLSGDKNPLHADPDFARAAGFERPILHGLCTYGIAAKAAVDTALGGDVTRMSGFRARFVGVVLPGETLRISIWEEADRLILAADVPTRDGAVLAGSLVRAGVPATVSA